MISQGPGIDNENEITVERLLQGTSIRWASSVPAIKKQPAREAQTSSADDQEMALDRFVSQRAPVALKQVIEDTEVGMSYLQQIYAKYGKAKIIEELPSQCPFAVDQPSSIIEVDLQLEQFESDEDVEILPAEDRAVAECDYDRIKIDTLTCEETDYSEFSSYVPSGMSERDARLLQLPDLEDMVEAFAQDLQCELDKTSDADSQTKVTSADSAIVNDHLVLGSIHVPLSKMHLSSLREAPIRTDADLLLQYFMRTQHDEGAGSDDDSIETLEIENS